MTILREIAAPFVADPAAVVCIRTRLKGLTAAAEAVLRRVGTHLGRLAGADLAARVSTGLGHDKDGWAERKRDLTVESTARWAGSITKATHDRWGLARGAQAAPAAYCPWQERRYPWALTRSPGRLPGWAARPRSGSAATATP